MSKKILAYDLGTGGNKATLYDIDGKCLASAFVPYDTYYPENGFHEQSPMDWWKAIIESTHRLLDKNIVNKKDIDCLAISGHSLGAVPIDKKGNLLREKTPIWSDTRAQREVKEFFEKVDRDEWYLITGNGFPPACYTVFKIMWYKDNEPNMYSKIYKIIGTKDFINFKMTGEIKTDYSYASGSGVYNLKEWDYYDKFIEASGLTRDIFPDIVPSTYMLGELTKNAAEELGLTTKVKVICGGVDNSCMALGAGNIAEGKAYTSLGSSAWIAVSSENPILDVKSRPFVFTHVIPKMFTSAVSIFSAGSSLKWVRDNLCKNIVYDAKNMSRSAFEIMDELASCSPIGANKLLFNPSLAGGSPHDKTPNIRGAYMGLDLRHKQEDLIRSCMEGIALNLRANLDILRKCCNIDNNIMFVGGGSKSKFWLQIFADVFNANIIKTNIDQDAGSLGAAVIAAKGSGLWKDFNKINEIHKIKEIIKPSPKNVSIYEKILPIFKCASEYQGKLGDMLYNCNI